MIKSVYNIFHRHYHSRYHGFYKHAKQLFVFDMALLAFALFLFGSTLWLMFWKPGVSNLVDISISLGSGRIRSGDDVHLIINYKNNSKIKLTDAYLSLRLPQGFSIGSTSPSFNTSANNFKLDDLPPGSEGTAELSGRLWTNVGGQDKIAATFSYKQENSQNTEQSVGIYYVNLTESVLSGIIGNTSSAFSGTKLPYTIKLTNNGDQTIGPVSVMLNGTRSGADTTLGASMSTTTAGQIELPSRTTDFPLEAELRVLSRGTYFTQGLLKNIVHVVKPDVGIRANFDNKLTYGDPGTVIPLEITWKNNDSIPFNDQKIRLTFTRGLVDLAATAKDNRLERDKEDLLVTSKTRTKLTDGVPGATETFTLNIHLLPTFSKKADGVTKLNIKPFFEGGTPGVPGRFAVEGTEASLPLPAVLSVKTSARYYTDEGDQLGRGPLPPVVGKTTKYWIFATLDNSINSLNGGRFVFTLGPGVIFTGKQSVSIGPELYYNTDSRVVSWIYDGSIPADSESGIYFEVALTPDASQNGSQPTLVTSANFASEDAVVGKKFEVSIGSIKNKLPSVDQGSRSGTAIISR